MKEIITYRLEKKRDASVKKLVSVLLVITLLVSAAGLSAADGEKKVLVQSIKIKNQKVTLPVGKSLKLTVEIRPKNASNTKLKWRSLNQKICTVENGKITAVGVGKCSVECTAEDGSKKTAKILVTVYEPGTPILFRNVPWGSDMATVIEKGGFARYSKKFKSPNAFCDQLTADYLNGYFPYDGCQTGFSVTTKPSGFDVEGYKPDYASMVFAYGSEDGKIVTDREKAQLILGQYSFYPQDAIKSSNAVRDLTTKLTRLYGKPIQTGDTPRKEGAVTFDWSNKHTVWMDDNGNEVVLSYTDYSIRLNYIWAKADKRLKAIYNKLYKPEKDQSDHSK